MNFQMFMAFYGCFVSSATEIKQIVLGMNERLLVNKQTHCKGINNTLMTFNAEAVKTVK